MRKIIITFSLMQMLCLSFSLGAEAVSSAPEKVDQSYVNDANKDADTSMKMATLSLLTASFLAPIYVKTCHNQPSTWIFGGTAALLLAGEVANYSKYKNATKAAEDYYNSMTAEESGKQAAAFYAAEAQTKAAAEAMKRKAQLSKLAALGFTAASAMSIVEAVSPWFNGGVCTTMNDVGPTNIYAQNSDARKTFSLINSYFFQIGEKQSLGLKEYSAFLVSFQLTGKFFSSIVNTAQAGFSGGAADSKKLQPVGIIIGAGSAAGILYANVVVQRARDMVSSKMSGYVRAAVFAANAGFAYLVTTRAEKSQEAYENAARQHKMVGDQFAQMSNSVAHSGTSTIVSSLDENVGIGAVKNDVVVGTDPCFVQSSNNETLMDSTCSCKKTNSCKQAELPSVKMLGFMDPSFQSVFTKSLKPIGDYSQQLYNGNFSTAGVDSAEIGRFAGTLNKMRDRLIADINKKRQKDGKSAFNLKDVEKKWSNKFNRDIDNSLNSLDPVAKGRVLAGVNYDSDLIAQDPNTVLDLAKKQDLTNIIPKKGSAGATDSDDSKKPADPFGNYSFDAQPGTEELASSASNAANNVEDQGSEDGEQISTDQPGQSLFTILTKRYISSGYPRLFKTIK